VAVSVKVKYLGLHPWDVLNIALFERFGFSIGTWSIIVGLLLIVVSLLINKKYVNIGTFLNALLIGLGGGLHVSGGLGAGPRDGFISQYLKEQAYQ